MQIIFLVPDLHLCGGGERVSTLLANHFVSRGNGVTILSVATSGTEQRFAIDTRVRIEYLNIELKSGLRILRKIESLLALRKYFKTVNGPTFLLGMGNYPILLAASLPRKTQIKTIGCQHGSYASVKYIWAILRWLIFRRLDAVVSLTNRDLPKLKRHNANVWVIPNPITFYPERPAGLQNKIILSVGRIDFSKGYDLLLEVFERFCRVNKDWKLKIIGDGPLRTFIEKSISNKGLTDRISILPATKKIEDEYLNASVYLMTSRTEGLPMVLLEAQACGLPIIAFDCETGPAEIVTHGENGYLIEANNLEVMSKRLLELCADPLKRKAFGKNARESVKHFFPDAVFGKWDELFESIQIKP